ncbi:MAG: hypothetical protein ACW99A_14615, partial [Candidatus Kariarchaeaceae archaeon]
MGVSKQNERSVDLSYQQLLNRMREYLLIIINITVAILAIVIYPLERFNDHEILITLTLIVCGIVTFYYLLTIPTVNFKITTILLILLLINTSIAGIVINVPFYHLISISVFYLFVFLIRKGISESISNYFMDLMILLTYASSVLFWYFITIFSVEDFENATISNSFIVEVLVVQILLAFFAYGRMIVSKQVRVAPLPFVYSLLILPTIKYMQDEVTTQDWLVDHIIDLQLIMYCILFLIFIIPTFQLYSSDDYSYFFIVQSILLPLIFIVSTLSDIEFNNYKLDTLEIVISPFSVIFIAYTASLFL